MCPVREVVRCLVGLSGRYPPKVDPCAQYQFPGRVCLSGRCPPKGTAPDAAMVRGCSVEGAWPGRFTTGWCVPASPVVAAGRVCVDWMYISSGQVCPVAQGVPPSAVRIGTQHADGAHDEGAGHLGIDGDALGGELVQRGQVVLGAFDAVAAVAVLHAFAAQ